MCKNHKFILRIENTKVKRGYYMKKHRAFWREVRKRAFAWLLVGLLVVGIVRPLEYGHATSNGEPQNEAETILEGGEETKDVELEEGEDNSELSTTPFTEEIESEMVGEALSDIEEASDGDDSDETSEENSNENSEENISDATAPPMKKGPAKSAPAPEEIDLSGYDWSTVDAANESDPKILAVLEYMASIQAMIDALPDTSLITKSNSVEVFEAFIAIMDAMDLMEDEVGVNYFVVVEQNASLIDDAHLSEVEEKLSQVVNGADMPSAYALPSINEGAAISLPATAYGEVEIYKTENFDISKNPPGVKLDTDNVSVDTEFVIVLQIPDLTEISEGQTYSIDIPQVVCTNAVNMDMTTGDIRYGKLLIPANSSKMYVAFGIDGTPELNGKPATLQDVHSVAMAFTGKIDASQRPVSGDTVDIQIGTSDKKITLKVPEWGTPDAPLPPAIDKTVSGTNNATWTIKYTPPKDGKYQGNSEEIQEYDAADTATPHYIKDTLPEGLVLDEDSSIVIQYEDGTVVPETAVIFNSYDQSTGVIIWELVQRKNYEKGPFTITYKTKVDSDTTDKKIENWAYPTKTNHVMGIKNETDTAPIIVGTQNLEAQKSITINSSDEKPKTVSKSGAYNADTQTITWTVTIDPKLPGVNFTKFNLVDDLGNALGDIIGTSITVTPYGGTASPLDSSKLSGTGTRTQTINLKDTISTWNTDKYPFTVSYQTQVKDTYFSGGGTSEDLKNKASLDWEAKNNSGAGLISVYDNKTKTPGIVVTSGAPDVPAPAFISKKGVSYNKDNRQFTWKIGVGGKYDTSGVFQPDASLEFKKIVLVDYPVNGGISDGPNTHQTFVNPNATTLTSKETQIAQDKQVIIEAIKSAIFGTTGTTITSETELSINVVFKGNTYNQLEITIEANGESKYIKPFEFEVHSYSTHPDAWTGHKNISTQQGHNKVVLDGDGTTNKTVLKSGNLSGQQPAIAHLSIPALISLEKFAVKYDNATKEITWKLEVNKSHVDLGNIMVLDTIPAGLKYVADSAVYSVNGGTETDFDTLTSDQSSMADPFQTGLFDNNAGILKFYLSNVTKEKSYIITFRTAMDINGTLAEPYLSSSNLTFQNKSKLHVPNPAYNGDWQSAADEPSATVKMPNQLVEKQKQENGQKVSYTVNLNPYGMNLVADSSKTTWVEDTLGEGLVLDVSSIKLYKGVLTNQANFPLSDSKDITIGDADDMTQGDEIVLATGDIEFKANLNQVRIKLPNDEQPYILTYDAYIMKKNSDLSNQVRILANDTATADTAGTRFVTSRLNASSRASLRLPIALLSEYVQVAILKVSSTGSTIATADAKFGMFSDLACTNLICEGTVDDLGNLTLTAHSSEFPGGVIPDKVYIKETVAPTGYQLNPNVFTVDPNSTGTGDEADLTIPNVLNTVFIDGQLSIHKVDEDGNDLADAVFALYSDAALTMQVGQGTSGADGMIVFQGLERNHTYYAKEVAAPDGYILDDITVYTGTTSGDGTLIAIGEIENKKASTPPPPIPDPKPDPKPSGNEGNNGSDDSSDSSTTPPPAKPADNKAIVQNGKIPQTGQLWWPVWLMGGLGSLFLILGFLWKPKKKK